MIQKRSTHNLLKVLNLGLGRPMKTKHLPSALARVYFYGMWRGRKLIWILCVAVAPSVHGQKLAVLKYEGGGDWYANPTALPNLARFCNESLSFDLDPKVDEVSFKSDEVFAYPFIHMTGHGNVVWSREEMERIRKYLSSGGFLHIDDNYGMDRFVRPLIEQLYSDASLEPLGSSSFLFHYPFELSEGLPKVHAHDGQKPQALALRRQGRIVLLYTFEADLGDGWEDEEVHGDAADIRLKALQMGANILTYAFTGRTDVEQ